MIVLKWHPKDNFLNKLLRQFRVHRLVALDFLTVFPSTDTIFDGTYGILLFYLDSAFVKNFRDENKISECVLMKMFSLRNPLFYQEAFHWDFPSVDVSNRASTLPISKKL